MANLYLVDESALAQAAAGSLVRVEGEEGRHAVRVSRLREGESTELSDGAGTRAHGVVEEVGRDAFAVRLTGVVHEPAPAVALTLVQALAKGDRDERAVEQATEFAADAIVPWQAERSVSRWSGEPAKASKGVAKWQRIAREAAKQSMRSRVPQVCDPATLDDLCDAASSAALDVIVLHPRGEEPLSGWAPHPESPGGAVWVVVGPEGGFTEHELDRLSAAGASVRTLGDAVLRTSSAGPAALAILNVALGRW